jgi:hypothetical protein
MKAGTLDALVCSKVIELLYLTTLSLFIGLQTVYNFFQAQTASINALSTMCACLSLLHLSHNQLVYNGRLWLAQKVLPKRLGYWLFDVFNYVLLRKRGSENSLEMQMMSENAGAQNFGLKWAVFTIVFVGTAIKVSNQA